MRHLPRSSRHQRRRLIAAAGAAVLAAAAAGLVSLAGAASADTANLLTNPGFETGDLTGWSCDAGTATVVTSPVHSGSHALQGAPSSSAAAQCT